MTDGEVVIGVLAVLAAFALIVLAAIRLPARRRHKPKRSRPGDEVGLPLAARLALEQQGLQHHCDGAARQVQFSYRAPGQWAPAMTVRIDGVYGFRGRKTGYRWADAIFATPMEGGQPRLFLTTNMSDFRDTQTGEPVPDPAAWLAETYRLNQTTEDQRAAAPARAPRPRAVKARAPTPKPVAVPTRAEVVMFDYADADGAVTLRMITLQRLYLTRVPDEAAVTLHAIGGHCHARKAWRRFRADRITGLKSAGASRPLETPVSWLLECATELPDFGLK